MTQEEKQLLLQDLCARLPYGIFVHTWYNKPLDIGCTGVDIYTNTIRLDLPDDYYARVYIDNVKLYLRPMSSMTEDEKTEYRNIIPDIEWNYGIQYPTTNKLDWCNKNHFDYRGLIEKGLALEAPEGMYKEWISIRGNLKEDKEGNIVGGLEL